MVPVALRRGASPPKSFEALRIRIAISSCLLGEKVRFDGGHKRAAYVTEVLANYFDLVPVCPEVAIGMGVPREPIHLQPRHHSRHRAHATASACPGSDPNVSSAGHLVFPYNIATSVR